MSENKSFEELFIVDQGVDSLKKKELNIIFLSDIHESFNYLEKLKEWQMKHKILFDYLLCGGDFLSLKNEEQSNSNTVFKSEGIMSSILNYLECICLNVVYIPGNHDPYTLFNLKSPKLTVRSTNIHSKFFQLDKDLFLFGFGGSIPAFPSKLNVSDCNLYEEIDYENNVYSGYPFEGNYKISDEKLFEGFKKGWEDSKNQLESEKQVLKQVILLTHLGPFYSQTTINQEFNKYIYMGSKYLDNFIKKSDNILLDLHGHTHDGEGMTTVGKVKVINPGTFLKGNFSIVKLKRNYNNEWKLEKLEIINLDFN